MDLKKAVEERIGRVVLSEQFLGTMRADVKAAFDKAGLQVSDLSEEDWRVIQAAYTMGWARGIKTRRL